tara:strand:- start:281698 stop:285447 length:3750 start_codon:yes stop_codon:yes gene_type:complete
MKETERTDADQAIALATELLLRAAELQTPQERRQQAELDRMINRAEDKATMVEMTDQAFRTHTPARVADQLTHLLDVQGVPRFFSPLEQAMLRGFQSFGEYLPGVAVPLVKEKMRRETANVILPAESDLLSEHLRERQQHGVQMNVNLLGEAILGEAEARRRIQQCIDTLRLDDVHCLSVKISTLYSQVSPIARRHTIALVADRLESLYRTARRETDSESGKFIYLDMEEYRDLHLTADIICETLDREGMDDIRAGIALQAYIPDSFGVMQRLIQWSRQRVRRGGTPLTIRLVKGANMEMERVEASIAGFAQAPFQVKLDTDANYKKMLRELIDAASASEVRVGVASHNLFDVALALVWTARASASENVQMEMLEGMANHQRRAISERGSHMLLYAPACRRDGFLNAIGYLIRRLDENTGPDNFLRHAYRLRPGTDEFEQFVSGFRESLRRSETLDTRPRRNQDRRQPPAQPAPALHWSKLVNEPDTDWALPHNADWAESVLDAWKSKCDNRASEVPLFIGSQPQAESDDQMRTALDPSRPGVVVCRYQMATRDQVKQAVSVAAKDESGWRETTCEYRHKRLRQAAQQLRIRRGELIGAMAADAGKIVSESDPEISEAIDFCEFYPLTMLEWDTDDRIKTDPRGVVAVITPWNFPLAIACGGVAASLAAGNTVILKPASETVLTASLLCEAFWDAGVPRDVLQMVPCEDADAEHGLVRNVAVDAVVLTGGTATAKRMLSVRPNLHLLAETGGKNATIVTAMADRDAAIKHVVQSAFGHAGQKCSATSLLLLQDEVFHDESFKATLADAVNSLSVGSAWDLHTKVGPLISEPHRDLARGIKALEDDETWLVAPEHIVENPNLYRPGVKWNIQPGGFAHVTELFGPVLGVMAFTRLEEAIEIVRRTGYGLTSGLETLDDREIELWQESIHAGNLYINRPTTGAIVLRQPFGGVGLSAYGPGVKAGGPHYVLALSRIRDAGCDAAVDKEFINSETGRNQTVGGETADDPVDGNPVDSRTDDAPIGQDKTARRGAVADAIDAEPGALSHFLHWLDEAQTRFRIGPLTTDELKRAVESQRRAVEEEFSREHDTVRLVGQDNIRRYRPIRSVTIRVARRDELQDALISVAAAVAVGTQVTLSLETQLHQATKDTLESTADHLPGWVHPIDETDQELAARINEGHVNRLRLLSPLTADSVVELACAEQFVTSIDEPVLREGRIECLRYLDEQSISYDYHRYGNLGRRADEPRREVL